MKLKFRHGSSQHLLIPYFVNVLCLLCFLFPFDTQTQTHTQKHSRKSIFASCHFSALNRSQRCINTSTLVEWMFDFCSHFRFHLSLILLDAAEFCSETSGSCVYFVFMNIVYMAHKYIYTLYWPNYMCSVSELLKSQKAKNDNQSDG